MQRFLIIISFITLTLTAWSQDIPEHVSNEGIYEFIDELAGEQVIQVNSVVKPYSKQFIYEKLKEAEAGDSLLNKRQRQELTFYMREYVVFSPDTSNPFSGDPCDLVSRFNITGNRPAHGALPVKQLGFIYKDSLFTAVIKPVWGVNYRMNDSGSVRHFWGGIRAYATIGEHWGIYASLRDNSITEILSLPGYFTRREGGNYKAAGKGREGGDFSEMRGGAVYSWNWGSIGLVKDHIQWGDHNYGPNIIDSRAPSFAMIKLKMKPARWFEFNYIHGWLVSEVIDSTNSYYSQFGEYRAKFRPKNIAANMFTFHPWSHSSISFGNSIIYSDLGGAHPAYLIPFMFFKSIDHTLNHGIQNQNSQLFLNLSTRQLKHTHVYGSIFVDEFSTTRLGNQSRHNFLSYKGGLKIMNWPLQNLSFNYEFTHTNPMTYKHRIKTTTFATNEYNLGHYLKDNSREHTIAATYKPLARLHITAFYQKSWHGNDYPYNINYSVPIDELPILQEKTWDKELISFTASYELLNNVYLKLFYEYSNIQGFDADGKTAEDYLMQFTPQFYHGKQHTFGMQFNMGF